MAVSLPLQLRELSNAAQVFQSLYYFAKLLFELSKSDYIFFINVPEDIHLYRLKLNVLPMLALPPFVFLEGL